MKNKYLMKLRVAKEEKNLTTKLLLISLKFSILSKMKRLKLLIRLYSQVKLFKTPEVKLFKLVKVIQLNINQLLDLIFFK